MKYDLVRFSNGQYGVRRTRFLGLFMDFEWLSVPGTFSSLRCSYFRHCRGMKHEAETILAGRGRGYVVVLPEGERLLNGKTKE